MNSVSWKMVNNHFVFSDVYSHYGTDAFDISRDNSNNTPSRARVIMFEVMEHFDLPVIEQDFWWLTIENK